MPRTLHRRYGRAGLKVRPFIMWVEDAMRESGVRRPELGTPEWRRRFKLWYDHGETVQGAAEMLRKWPWPKTSSTPTGDDLRGLRERMARVIRERKGE